MGEKSHKIGHFLERQSPKFNDPAVLRFGCLETAGEMDPGWGPGKPDHFFMKKSQQGLSRRSLPSGVLELGVPSLAARVLGSFRTS